MTNPPNHNQRWSIEDLHAIKKVDVIIDNKAELEEKKSNIAEAFGRKESAVCQKIEQEKGWFWAEG